ncbi:DUF262 domain-containing protein [Wenzhouxiangella sp. XN79A]|uniref:DUF262 domain-containing protein n=1 Tax=Wenzhouxiangella sp. XN79A TaxID=2724193 RepID=UPI00144AAEDE|nr:DUF262 domain-containing protein [Wenzhouxiangella sp. XN79A]NKI35131.1 DUF262 domain-containing protein [Wenzhouxiangella sp. XN79A]
MSNIEAKEKRIGKVLCSDYEFHIPDYQRPYSWTEEQAEELFSDLLGFMRDTGGEDKYFLGSIVLVKGDSTRAEVVDGQQRITTLTILFAAIHERLRHAGISDFRAYIVEPGNIAENLEARPRLFLRRRDAGFFRQHLQDPGGFDRLLSLDPEGLTDPRKNIALNTRYFRDRLGELTEDDALRLGQFIVRNCYLVVVSTDHVESAYRIFSVLNDRGLDLETSDILKAELIGRIPADLQEEYTARWETIEESLGRKGLNELIAHVRMIYRKEKARRSVLDEFRAHVVAAFENASDLVDDALIPYADAFDIISRQAWTGSGKSAEINSLLALMDRLNNVDWVPVAMEFMRRFRSDPELLLRQLRALERLAGSMFVRGVYVTPRIERLGKVLKALDAGENLLDSGSPLQLSADEAKRTLELLDGEIYTYPAKLRMYIMLRIDSFLSGPGATYDHRITTIEHVLPQNPSAQAEWKRSWMPAQRELWVNRLGNLLLLSRAKNAQASNYDFDEKKKRYFTTGKGVSSYAISTQVLNEEEWTPEVVERRQHKLLDEFNTGWQLEVVQAEL